MGRKHLELCQDSLYFPLKTNLPSFPTTTTRGWVLVLGHSFAGHNHLADHAKSSCQTCLGTVLLCLGAYKCLTILLLCSIDLKSHFDVRNSTETYFRNGYSHTTERKTFLRRANLLKQSTTGWSIALLFKANGAQDGILPDFLLLFSGSQSVPTWGCREMGF